MEPINFFTSPNLYSNRYNYYKIQPTFLFIQLFSVDLLFRDNPKMSFPENLYAITGTKAVLFVMGSSGPPGFKKPEDLSLGNWYDRFPFLALDGDLSMGSSATHTHTYSDSTGYPNQDGVGGGNGNVFAPAVHNHNFSGSTSGPDVGLPPYIKIKPCIWTMN